MLTGLVVLFLVSFLFAWLYINRVSAEQQQALLDFRKQEIALQAANGELEKIRNELDTLVRDRIPGLLPLKYDEAITIDNDYVRNIIFTLVKNGKKSTYEYRLVMQNNTLSVIRPVVEILLFNEIGIQIGVTQVEQMDATGGAERSALDPGEVRSYTASINLIRNEEPRYFLLAISEASRASAETLRRQLGDVVSR